MSIVLVAKVNITLTIFQVREIDKFISQRMSEQQEFFCLRDLRRLIRQNFLKPFLKDCPLLTISKE